MLDDVLPSCRRVAETSRHVALDPAALQRFAVELAPLLPKTLSHTPHHFIGAPADTVSYFLVLDALNFGSGFFEHIQPYRGEDGYFALATALRDWIIEAGAPTPAALRALTSWDVARILGQDAADEALTPLFAWAVRALRELAGFIAVDLRGDVLNLLRDAGYDAAKVVALLCRMPMFQDVSRLDGQEVWLLKRAQIFIHDLAIAAPTQDGVAITGLERLTVFADNVLPFILEAKGVLIYDAALADRIAAGAALAPGERAEIELRANSIHACELIRQAIIASGVAATARDIDFALWNAGALTPSDGRHRPHVCRTYFY